MADVVEVLNKLSMPVQGAQKIPVGCKTKLDRNWKSVTVLEEKVGKGKRKVFAFLKDIPELVSTMTQFNCF